MTATAPVMSGTALALKYARRDLPVLDAAVALCSGRTAAIQAGGCLGVYPKHLAQSFDTVYTFEPSASLFQLLATNAPEPNIIKLQAALGCARDLVGTCQVRRDGKAGNHEGITHIVPGGSVPTLRIDDLALPICDLIQLDLEGWELYALRGAAETIQRCRPVVLVEINKGIEFVGFRPEDVRNYLYAAGYQFLWRQHSDEAWVPA